MWAEKGVWSAVAQKIHYEQLKHVQKGCLKHSNQDIRSDGSHVEGTHKGWNSLQCAQLSGIMSYTILLISDPIISVQIRSHKMTPFMKFTYGSHHIQLSNHVAKLYNGLQEKGTPLLSLSELPNVDSGETFGLVASDNTTTFGGLLIKEETPPTDAMVSSAHQMVHLSSVDSQIFLVCYLRQLPMMVFLLLKSCLPLQANTRLHGSHLTQMTSLTGRPSVTSTGVNNSTTTTAGQTQSQCLFSIAMGINPCSLILQNLDEFYLFMDMRAEFKWLSYQMTSKRWVLAMEEYNHHLIEKIGQSVIQKNQQAFLCVLGDIKPKLMSKITRNNYTCESVLFPPFPHYFLFDIGPIACRNSKSLFHCSPRQGRLREKG
ncbi:hypothetical protein BDR07DRAFT_1288516 [Suillus spraguei]|nr:hypothetical protein BDR07DRAFT_1288516 [Suillus spraguei]